MWQTVTMTELYADIRLGTQGRLVVPAPIRRALGFSDGETLVARTEQNHLIIEKTSAVERRVHARFRGATGRCLADELINERRREAQRDGDL